MKRIFETIATAKVSTSAYEARTLGFLSPGDTISMNRERIPLLFVQDVSGFMVGSEAEHEGIIRAGAR